MQWLWNHILKPVFNAVADLLWNVVKWAFLTPVAGIVIGLSAAIGSLFFPPGSPQRLMLAVWGITMATAGVLGWLWPKNPAFTDPFPRLGSAAPRQVPVNGYLIYGGPLQLLLNLQ